MIPVKAAACASGNQNHDIPNVAFSVVFVVGSNNSHIPLLDNTDVGFKNRNIFTFKSEYQSMNLLLN